MIIRSAKNKNYTVISNVGISDDRLSLKSRGLYAYLLTKPDQWSISDRGLSSVLPEGRDSIAGALKELEEAGYLQRVKKQASGGKFKWEATLFEEPMAGKPSHGESNSGDNGEPTMAGLSVAGKPSHIVNTDKVINNYTEIEKTQALDLHRGYIKHFKLDLDDYQYATGEQRAEMARKAEANYKLTDKRLAKAVARIRDIGYVKCRQAIININKEAFYHGENDRSWKMDLYEYLFRNYEKVEEWANK